MKRIWVSLIAAGLLTIAAVAPAAGQSIFSVALDSVDDSGIQGGASIRGVDGQVEVSVYISEGETDGVHPVHIHEGTCDELGDVAYPLEDIVDGSSESVVEVSLADIMTGEYAINAHMSEDDMATNVMCGNIPLIEGLAADDDAAEEDDAATDDDAAEEDDAATDDEAEEDDDAADIVPAAGSTGGVGTDTAVVLMTLMAGAAVGTGLLVRRRLHQA